MVIPGLCLGARSKMSAHIHSFWKLLITSQKRSNAVLCRSSHRKTRLNRLVQVTGRNSNQWSRPGLFQIRRRHLPIITTVSETNPTVGLGTHVFDSAG